MAGEHVKIAFAFLYVLVVLRFFSQVFGRFWGALHGMTH